MPIEIVLPLRLFQYTQEWAREVSLCGPQRMSFGHHMPVRVVWGLLILFSLALTMMVVYVIAQVSII